MGGWRGVGGWGVLISMQGNSSIHSDEHPKAADHYPMKGGPYRQEIIVTLILLAVRIQTQI